MTRIPEATIGRMLQRGVYKAPWMGPNGEFVFLVVKDDQTLLCDPITVPNGHGLVKHFDELWEMLDGMNPISSEVEDKIRRRLVRSI